LNKAAGLWMELIKRILAFFFDSLSYASGTTSYQNSQTDKSVMRINLSKVLMAQAIRKNVT
jgi:hypothetical protein